MEDRPILEFIDTYTPFLRVGTEYRSTNSSIKTTKDTIQTCILI
jgi:hypothetical protein